MKANLDPPRFLNRLHFLNILKIFDEGCEISPPTFHIIKHFYRFENINFQNILKFFYIRLN